MLMVSQDRVESLSGHPRWECGVQERGSHTLCSRALKLSYVKFAWLSKMQMRAWFPLIVYGAYSLFSELEVLFHLSIYIWIFLTQVSSSPTLTVPFLPCYDHHPFFQKAGFMTHFRDDFFLFKILSVLSNVQTCRGRLISMSLD